MIPYDNPSKPMKTPANPFAIIGMLIFALGLWLMFSRKNGSYASIAIIGFAFAVFSMLFGALARRRGWLRVKAICLDKEIGMIGNREWEFRLRCKFELAGRTYIVTPTFWQSYGSEQEINNFLHSFIGPDGSCTLSVNPHNPLHTEIVSDKSAALLNQTPE